MTKRPENRKSWILGEIRFIIKSCNTCRIDKSIEDFYPPTHNGKKSYTNPKCRLCCRATNKRTRYLPENLERFNNYKLHSYHRITPKEFMWLFDRQNGVCAVCLDEHAYTRNNKLVIDHDHKHAHLGRRSQVSCRECIRGLLCDGCNLTFGLLEPRFHLQNEFVINYLKQRPFLDVYDKEVSK